MRPVIITDILRYSSPVAHPNTIWPVQPGLPALLMTVDLQIHDVIPDVGIDVDDQGCHGRNGEQPPVSTGKPDFPPCDRKPQQDSTDSKRNEPLDTQDSRECSGVYA